MAAINISLHPAQQQIWNSKARFVSVAAGRRFGKTQLAVGRMALKGLTAKAGVGLYMAPTLQQAKELVWQPLKDMLLPIGAKFHENDATVMLPNGRKLLIGGADRPDARRGLKLYDFVADEYQDFKPSIFESIVYPALIDLQGGALFIGTPKGRNHFYEQHKAALDGRSEDAEAFSFTTADNPFIPRSEIELAKRKLSSYHFRQEFMASFEALESDLFKADWVRTGTEPSHGNWIVAVDLAGFTDYDKVAKSNSRNLDETAISIVKVMGNNWWVKDIVHGRWTVAETAGRIVKAVQDTGGYAQLGIEKGVLFQAIYPAVMVESIKKSCPVNLSDLTHGNTNKTDRILWAIQAKLEHGEITFNPGEYLDQFKDQLFNFPDSKVHDDLVDSLSMVAQMAPLGGLSTAAEMIQDTHFDLDNDMGY